MLIKLLFLCILSALSVADRVRYDNYTLYKVYPQSEEHVKFLKELYDEPNKLDFWMAPSKPGHYVSVVASPEAKEEFEHSLKKRSISSEVMLTNIQEAYDAQLNSRRRRDTSGRLFWTNYQTLDEIEEWFHELAREHPNVVTVVTGGYSYEGRNITGVRISRRSGRRAFFLEGGQIAADWLSPTVLTYFVNELVNSDNPEARAASEDFDWHIFPVVNPDGYQFTQDSVRLWLKNRRNSNLPNRPSGIGVDLTRNWNSQWGVSGGSFNPADQNFHGLGPFSEPETRSLSGYIENINSLVGVLSFRSFGQRLLIPFAHTSVTDGTTNNTIYNYDEMITIGRRAMGSLAVRYNTQYIVGTSKDAHDGATGVLVDWAKHRFNPPIAATYHLRDTGTWGYLLPVAQVLPSCEETFDSLLAIIREARHINVL